MLRKNFIRLYNNFVIVTIKMQCHPKFEASVLKILQRVFFLCLFAGSTAFFERKIFNFSSFEIS